MSQQDICDLFAHVKTEPLHVQSKIEFNAMIEEEKQKKDLGHKKPRMTHWIAKGQIKASLRLIPVRAMGSR